MDGTLLEKKYDIVGRIKALEEGGGELPANVIVEDDIAYQFSTTSSYLAGTFVYKDNQLYRFDVDHEAGAWNTEEVTGVRICDSIISEFGNGLQRTGNEVYVKLKNDGNLGFNSAGELYADIWYPAAITINESESGFYLGTKKIYHKELVFESPITLTSNTWVNLGVTMAVESFVLGIALASDGTSVPVCLAYDSTVGVQVLNMRTASPAFNKFILFYTKPDPVTNTKKSSKK